MGMRNASREELRRLEAKTLDARFVKIVREGLGCSPFEAKAVLGVVKEVYFPFVDEAATMGPPGKMTVIAVSAEEPAGKAVADCEKCTVCVTVHRGTEDDRLLHEQGPKAFRRSRLGELCQEALSQGALLTREDLAYHVFYVSPHTISRDLAALRADRNAVPIPLRSTVHDIGPVLTHRVKIVELALEGKTTTQICAIMRHSPAAVGNYLSTFTRCAQLARRGLQVGQIAFLLRRGKALVQKYLQLLNTCRRDRNRAYHLREMLRLAAGKKKQRGRGRHGQST
jgi:predicted transcriptional regulator